jgi:peptide methionine sulfoxide reductase MsrB
LKEDIFIKNINKTSIEKSQLTFETKDKYFIWKDQIKTNLMEKIKRKLTPKEYNITQNQITERPFTGVFCNHYAIGLYSCKVCTQRVFSNTHKNQSDAGWASFWNFIPSSISIKEDHLEKFYFENRTGKFSIQNDNLGSPESRISCSNVSFFENIYRLLYKILIYIFDQFFFVSV